MVQGSLSGLQSPAGTLQDMQIPVTGEEFQKRVLAQHAEKEKLILNCRTVMFVRNFSILWGKNFKILQEFLQLSLDMMHMLPKLPPPLCTCCYW